MNSIWSPSAIIIIVAAIAIVIFIVHGLFFSSKPINRKLKAKDSKDKELLNTKNVGVVRIISADNKDSKINTDPLFDNLEAEKETTVTDNITIETKEEVIQHTKGKWKQSYEFNIVAPENEPFKGEDIEEIFNCYNMIRGDMDIFYVYENPQDKNSEVFRVCSLKSPFSFPRDMKGYTTPAIALYMNLPPKGKGIAYFKAITYGVEIFTQKLGGEVQDNSKNIINAVDFMEMEKALQEYDNLV